jgi:protein SCO1/2
MTRLRLDISLHRLLASSLLRLEVLVIGVIAVMAAGCGADGRQVAPPPPPTQTAAKSVWRGNPVRDPTAAPVFSLTDQSGTRVALAGLRGRVVLVTFLYTRCPDFCPLIASRLSTALRSLPPSARSQTRVLAISVDPEHDTRVAVRRFIAEHHLPQQFRYLTASRSALRPIWQAYNVVATPRNDSAIDHSAYIALVDRRGLIRVYFDTTSSSAAVAHDVRRALAG